MKPDVMKDNVPSNLKTWGNTCKLRQVDACKVENSCLERNVNELLSTKMDTAVATDCSIPAPLVIAIFVACSQLLSVTAARVWWWWYLYGTTAQCRPSLHLWTSPAISVFDLFPVSISIYLYSSIVWFLFVLLVDFRGDY
jgi:hypothetical protein